MTQTIVFAGGCFWCTEAVFQRISGVKKIEPGYSNGEKPNPTYEQVCSGRTGYAEVSKVEFDDKKVSFKELLEIFFKTHDPTQLNQQGNDIGTQYRSAIFYTTKKQEKIARDFVKEKQKIYPKKIVTEISELRNFYPAEAEHKDFYNKNKNHPYCQFIIVPKLEKIKGN